MPGMELALRTGSEAEHPTLLAAARAALEEAVTLPELTSLVDRAEIIRVAARKAQLSAEAQNDWAEFKLDAERQAGKALAEIPRMTPAEKGALGRGDPPSTHRDTKGYAEVITDAGISRERAARFQRIASLPDTTYEAHKVEARAKGELTEAGALRAAKAYKAAQQPPPDPPDIGVFAAKLARDMLRRFSPISDSMTQGLENLIKYKQHIPDDDRDDLAAALRDIAQTAADYAEQLETA